MIKARDVDSPDITINILNGSQASIKEDNTTPIFTRLSPIAQGPLTPYLMLAPTSRDIHNLSIQYKKDPLKNLTVLANSIIQFVP